MNEELDAITIKEFETLCSTAIELKREMDALEDAADEKRKVLAVYQRKIEGYLDHFGKEDWSSPSGDISLRTRTSVKTPKDEESKRALFAWLSEKQIFYETVSINSNTLNALYKSEMEAAAQESRDGTIPGIEAPTEFTTVIIKPKR